MQRLSVDPANPDLDALDCAVGVLGCGGLVGYPTETFYGLAADPRNDHAIDALFRAKARPARLSIPLIAGSLEQLSAVGARLDPQSMRLAARFWPGPLTLVIPAWAGLSVALLGTRQTVAVRVPGHLVARGLCERYGHPVTSTSANLSGDPPADDPDVIAAVLASSIELLLDGGRTRGGLPSTIVSVLDGEARLVRTGAIGWEQVLECLGQ